MYVCMYVYMYKGTGGYKDECLLRRKLALDLSVTTVDFRNFIVFLLGRDPGTLKSDIVSKKHPQLICSDLRLSN